MNLNCALLLGACLLAVAPASRAAVQVVDVIPLNQSAEADQNSEPSIAVQPELLNQGQWPAILIGAFGPNPASANPYFTSTDGGTIWTNPVSLPYLDGTVGWGLQAAYAARLKPDFTTIDVNSSPSPQTGVAFNLVAGSAYSSGSADQPWLKLATVGNADHLYVSYNDSRGAVRFSLDSGATWATAGLEHLFGVHDAPSVRVCPANDGKTVYAVFERWRGGAPDFWGDVAVVRDDNQGLNKFVDLDNGSVVASVTFPTSDNGGTALGSERLNGDCAIAVHPCDARTVYVAFTEVVQAGNTAVPQVQVFQSTDAGTNWTQILALPTNSALPALAVAANPNFCQVPGSVLGLLYTALVPGGNGGTYLETHFLEAVAPDFNQTSDVILARFPDGRPPLDGDPYIGDYQGLVAVGDTFYGTFSAANDPDPGHFPSGVYFQRYVSNNVTHVIEHNFKLKNAGNLVTGSSGAANRISIDPFFFKVTPMQPPGLSVQGCFDCPPPLVPEVAMRIYWLRDPLPYWIGSLETRNALDSSSGWIPLPNSNLQFTNGVATFVVTATNGLNLASSSQFFRVRLDRVPPPALTIEPAAGTHGVLYPGEPVTLSPGQSQSFVAVPDANYAVAAWYLDGMLVQTGGSSFTVTNIQDDHILTATFIPPYDLAISKFAHPNPVAVGSNLTYTIIAANGGLEPATNLTVLDQLPSGVGIVSVNCSIAGACTISSASNAVNCALPSLAPGEAATITIVAVAPTAVGTLTNTATVSGSSGEFDLDNNSSSAVVFVQVPPQILTQPLSQSVPAGSSVVLSVTASGEPLAYQWYQDGSPVSGATDSTLTLDSVTTVQTGSYTVVVSNGLGHVTSQPASVLIQ